MTSSIEFEHVAEHYPSLCIPRVFANIGETRIRQVFDELALGKIYRIDIIERKSDNCDVYKRVFIHFDKWFNNSEAQSTRLRLISGKDIKIVYDNPWFWKVSANRSEPKNTRSVVPKIEFTTELPRAPCLIRPELLPRAPCLTSDEMCPRTPGIKRPVPTDRAKQRPTDRDRQKVEQQSIPKLVLKAPMSIPTVIPRSPSSSPPRQRPNKCTTEKLKQEQLEQGQKQEELEQGQKQEEQEQEQEQEVADIIDDMYADLC